MKEARPKDTAAMWDRVSQSREHPQVPWVATTPRVRALNLSLWSVTSEVHVDLFLGPQRVEGNGETHAS